MRRAPTSSGHRRWLFMNILIKLMAVVALVFVPLFTR